MPRKAFIAQIKDTVIRECKGTGLFPSVMIAQACLESGDGLSGLSTKYFNYFGMKPGSKWKGPIVELLTTEYENGQPRKVKQPFRVYKSFDEGFADHVKLLQNVPTYRNHGVFTATSPEGQAKALRLAGYATDPGYPQKLISIVEQYFLKEYDQP
jgi:flagellum-specific peptidoglycan hydrolase FlgJ